MTFNITYTLFLQSKMSPTPLEVQRNAVKSLWQQNIRNSKEISQRLKIPLRSCERYVSLLRKTGKISIYYSSGRPRPDWKKTILNLRLVNVLYVVSLRTSVSFLF